MSPEQCKGAGTLDHRTDIYSLGVMLFEMLAGRPPFVAEGVGELFAKHMLEEPPSLLDFAPKTPPHMAAAIMKALQKEPRDRFQSMDEFRKAVVGEIKLAPAPTRSTAVRSPAVPGTQTFSPRPRPRCRRPRRRSTTPATPQSARNWKVLAALGVAAAIGGVALLVIPKSHDKPAPAPQAALTAPTPLPVAPPRQLRPWPRRSRCDSRPSLPAPTSSQDEEGRKGSGRDPGRAAGAQGGGALLLPVPAGGIPGGRADRQAERRPDAARLAREARRAARPPRTKHRAPAHHGGGAKHAKSPVDEDGLATPSF